jgi:integrase
MAVPRALVAVLTDQLARRGVTGADVDAFVFVSPEGAMLDYSHWRRRVWQPACVAVGLGEWRRAEPASGDELGRIIGYDGLGFHDLRRVNATALVAEGVDLKTAQARLGHSDPRLTLAVYAQATTEGDRTAADRLGERLMPDLPRDGRAMRPA